MPRVILKADPSEDVYLEWSTVVDAPTEVGSRVEMLEILMSDRPGEPQETVAVAEARLSRADMHGSSAFSAWRFGWWDDPILILQDFWTKDKGGYYTLTRENLLAFARAILAEAPDPKVGLVERCEE